MRISWTRSMSCNFYSRPCGRGDQQKQSSKSLKRYFYSRPCGRGDRRLPEIMREMQRFLLTPLREGRRLDVELRFEI